MRHDETREAPGGVGGFVEPPAQCDMVRSLESNILTRHGKCGGQVRLLEYQLETGSSMKYSIW